jgi:hypothetical protein
MKNIFKNRIIKSALGLSLLLVLGCQRDLNELEQAEFSKNPEVFIDDFSGGLNYAAFGGSAPKAFQVDTQVKYAGTKSMRFEVPDFGSPEGAYAGGSFFTSVGRDLSDYNALTFWVKATQSANIDIIGFGNDLGENKYQVSISALSVNTNWKKVYIPIPDASKLTAEKGMLFYSEGPENNKGYTFWIDEVKFEKVPGIAQGTAGILNGETKTVTSFVGVNQNIDGLISTFSLPNGINQVINLTPYYFNFSSSNASVATVNNLGNVSTVSGGSAVITATLGGKPASGSLTINSQGNFLAAPTPTHPADKVISLFSDAYTNVPVNYFNGYWGGSQTQSADFTVNGNNVLNYFNFGYFGISTPLTDVSATSHLQMDMFVPSGTANNKSIRIRVRDFGANGVDDGGVVDDTDKSVTFGNANLTSNAWNKLIIPMNIGNKSKIGLIIFDQGVSMNSFYIDNIYFYNDGSIIPSTPSAAAPAPSHPASGVLSVFSDAYTNVAGTDFNPNWQQSTVVSQLPIAGNNTLKYAGLNYQGTQFASPLNVSSYGFVHLDYYTANSSTLNFYLISPGPVEKSYTLSVPSGIGTSNNGWKSIDIPLSAFSPVALNNLIQFKVDGNGDIFFDNIYFHN